MLPDFIDGILEGDWPGSEFYIGGKVVKQMSDSTQKNLKDKEVTLDRSPQRILETVSEKAFSV
jgi:CRISPR-associated protein Cst2